MKIIFLAFFLLISQACAYNSVNLIRIRGKDMDVNYGLFAIKGVSEFAVLRETNSGSGEAKNNIPDIRDYLVISYDGGS